MKQSLLRSAAVVAAGLMGLIGGFVPRAWADVATGEWTKSTWTTFTKAENSLLRPRYLATDAGNSKSDVFFCDGSADDPYGAYFAGNRSITWKFPSAATITGARFYTYWGDGGRVDINITSIDVKTSEDGDWVSIANSGVDYAHSGSDHQLYAEFGATDGAALAEGVVAVRIVFPWQENKGVGYREMEILGSLAEADPARESEYEWTEGNFTKSTWTQLDVEHNGASNMMQYCSFILKNGADVTSSYSSMIDHSIAEYNSWILNGDTITWQFANAINLQAFSLFAGWGDGGRDCVSVLEFETQDEEGNWTKHFGINDEESWCIVGSPATYANTTKTTDGANYGTLRRKDGQPLATGIKAIRVYSYYADSAGSCWLEAEAEGWVEAANAIFDERSITTTNDCWDVTWTAALSSLGASDEVTVNLWTSLDDVNYTIADTKTVTAANTSYTFQHTFDEVDQTIYYRFETINTNGEKTWYTTNTVNSVVNHDNATYTWRADGVSGVWEDKANWSNSRNDSRLNWPTHEYTTADFSGLAADADVTVTVGASHTPQMKFAETGAKLKLVGTSAVTLTLKGNAFTGCVTVDGLKLNLPGKTFADGARLVAQNGAAVTVSLCNLTGYQSGIELLSGATLQNNGGYFYISRDSEIVLNGGNVTQAGYFTWAGEGAPATSRIVFGTLGGIFKAPQSHRMLNTGVCTFRYELPGGRWTGYEEAPLQPTKVNNDHQFGRGTFHVEVVDGEAMSPTRELELRLIELPSKDTIVTNDFTFEAFGEEMDVNVANGKGDYFYWTYDGGDATEPATAGTLPTGLRFHHAKRGGLCIRIQ